ncbi:MAG: hypothetical protein ACO1RT_00600, partial [Planctomycetaceae bacterium]
AVRRRSRRNLHRMNQSLSDVALIYIVLIVLYGVESIAWIRPGSTAIVTWFGRLRNPAANVRLARNESGHVVLFGLAPFDATFVVEPCPISLSPLGVLGFLAATPVGGDRPANTQTLCDWEEVKALRRDGRDLWVRERLLARLGSPYAAQKLATKLHAIARLPADQRGTAIDSFVDDQFNVPAIHSRLDEWSSVTRGVKAWSTLLAVWVIVVGGLRWFHLLPGFSDPETLWMYLGGLALIWWTTNVFVVVAHRKLYPASQPGMRTARWKLAFTALVSPAVTLRATDHLTRHLLLLVHPLAVFAAAGPNNELGGLAASVLRDLRYPQPPEIPDDLSHFDDAKTAIAIEESYRQSTIAAVLRLCQQECPGVHVAFDAPIQQDSGTVSYCPRCLQQFPVLEAKCSLCGDRSSIAIASPATEAATAVHPDPSGQ